MGFIKGEKGGVWVEVPEEIAFFKVDYFRVLIGNAQIEPSNSPKNTQVFFQMGIGKEYTPTIPSDIENAAQVTPGPYWNDIPAQGSKGDLRCATGGELIGAALEFTHTGLPSIYRDIDGLRVVQGNTLFAIPGGWNYSVVYGLRGDWILRIVGHEVTEDECQ